jgi:hypothetical protein
MGTFMESFNDSSIMHWDHERVGMFERTPVTPAIQPINNRRYEGTVHGEVTFSVRNTSLPA